MAEIEAWDELRARIVELEEALQYIIEDIDHEDHKKGDWSWQAVVKNARKVLLDEDPSSLNPPQ